MIRTNDEDIVDVVLLYLHRASSWVPGCLRRGLCDRTFGLSRDRRRRTSLYVRETEVLPTALNCFDCIYVEVCIVY